MNQSEKKKIGCTCGCLSFCMFALMLSILDPVSGFTCMIICVILYFVTMADMKSEEQNLNEFFSNDALTKEEWECIHSFVGNRDKTQQILETLAKLYELKQRGAITESEYNVKKWELLSEKLV